MRAMSWRPALSWRNGPSVTLSSYFAAGSYLPAARAPSGRLATAPRAVMVCRKLRRCMGILLRSLLELDLLAVEAAMVLLAPGGKDDLLAAHLAVDRHRALAGAQRPGKHLERLLERELALRQLVLAGDARRHDPEERGTPRAVARLHRLLGIGLPVAHGEGVRRDARAGLQRQELRPQLQVDIRQQEHGDHSGFREVGLEEIGLHELDAFVDTCLVRVLLRELDHVRVVLDAERARAALRRRDHRAAVARAEIDDIVLWRDARHVEHLVDHRLRRRHPDDVLAGLADFRLEGRRGGRALRLRLRGAGGEREPEEGEA